MDAPDEIKVLKDKLEELIKVVTEQQKQIDVLQQQMKDVNANRPFPTHQHNKTSPRSFELENFIGLRLIHLVGIVVLVTGISIGVKYAIDQNLISPFARVGLAYAAGGLLYALSLYLKNKYEAFSAILFSGSMASFYFTTYAATVYYNLIPGWLAFVIMIALTAYTAFTAIQYNRQEIAILGMVGAYGIPFLISKNTDASTLFFCYIFLINTGIVFLSFKRSWLYLKLLAFFITWSIFIGWTFIRYQPHKDQVIGISFIGLFYILFSASAVIGYLRNKKRFSSTDTTVIFFNNIAAYIASLVVFKSSSYEASSADVTGIFVVIFFLLAYITHKLFVSEKNLSKYLALQAVTTLIIYVALNFKGISITLFWSSIALALFVAGIYSNRSWPRLASIATFSLTLIKLIIFDSAKFSTLQKILAYLIIGSLLLIVSFVYQKRKRSSHS